MGNVRVDLHFHPNIYGNTAPEGICTAILENCLKGDIKALVVSEHVYKDPTAFFQDPLHDSAEAPQERKPPIRGAKGPLQGQGDDEDALWRAEDAGSRCAQETPAATTVG